MRRIEGRFIGIGETKMVKTEKMDQEEWDEIWAEARVIRRIEGRLIGMGETKMVCQNRQGSICETRTGPNRPQTRRGMGFCRFKIYFL